MKLKVIKRILNLLGYKTEDTYKERLIKDQGHAWLLIVDNEEAGYYQNLSKIADEIKDLHKSKLYYHTKRYGTYKDDKYEIVCQKS